jgi:translation initiation factor IF-2
MAAKIEHEKNAASTNITGADFLKMMNQQYESQDFNVLVKADVQGSLTSVIDSLKLIDTMGEIKLNIIGSGVGNISENDIRLAVGNNTIIYGFNVDISTAVKQLSVRDKVQVRIFKVIYQLLDDARESMQEMLAPEVVETQIGSMTIKGIFRTLKEEIIAGGEVTEGKIIPGAMARVMRKKELIAEVKVTNVRRQQAEAKEVFAGEMCGISLKISKKITIEEGDKIELFSRELVKRTLK